MINFESTLRREYVNLFDLPGFWLTPATPTYLAGVAVAVLREYGDRICQERGDHDYSIKVTGTPNMFQCFRCGEPGWEVPLTTEDSVD